MEHLRVRVVSAAALTEAQLSALKAALSKKTGGPVEISLSTDPSLIGGLRISLGGYVIDGSVKKQLSDMKDSLKSGKVRDGF